MKSLRNETFVCGMAMGTAPMHMAPKYSARYSTQFAPMKKT